LRSSGYGFRNGNGNAGENGGGIGIGNGNANANANEWGFLLWGGRGFEMSNKCFKLHELALFVISPSMLLLSLDWVLYMQGPLLEKMTLT